jgi:hypothetical protein
MKWRNIANESSPPGAVGTIVIDIIRSLNDKLANFAVPRRDIAIVIVACPLTLKYVDVSMLCKLFVAESWFSVEMGLSPFHDSI